MSYTLSPNMSLPVPTVGSESGPAYAFDINSALTILDQHNHSAGSGVQINPSGLNINSDLSFQNNNSTNLKGANFYLQTSSASIGQTLYVKNGTESPTPLPDLWYYDGTNQIQITSGGLLAAVPTSVPGLNYASGTFSFTQGASSTTPANLSSSTLSISPATAGSAATKAVVLSPPSGISSIYPLYLPTIPASQSFLAIDTSGNITGYASVSGGLTGSNLASGTVTGTQIANNTITATNIANNTIGTSQIAAGGILGANIASNTVSPSNLTSASSNIATVSSLSVSGSSFQFICAVTVSTVAGRPVLFNFTGSNITSTPTNNQDIYLSGSGVIAIFTIYNATASSYASGQIELRGTQGGVQQSFSPAVLNNNIIASSTGSTQYYLYGAVTTGGSCTIQNFLMQAIAL